MKIINYKVKNYIAVLLLIIAFVPITSCSNEEAVRDESKAKESKAEIKIDVMKNEHYLLAAISEFNETHDNVRISYDDLINFNEEYRNKYITSLAVGEGPDILRIEPRLFVAVNKMVNSGIFYDLNKLIDKDKDFKLSDYNQKVLESGVFNGKRFYIPLGYDFSTFFVKGGTLKENGFTTEGPNWTLANFADEAYSYTQKNKGKGFIVTWDFALSDIVKISGINFIDYVKKDAKFDSSEFIELINIYKKLNSTVILAKDVSASYTGSEDLLEISTVCPEFENGTALIMDNSVASPMWFRDFINQKTNLYLFPQYTSKKTILLEPMVSLAINSKCIHKDEAYEFIKLLLSDEYQSISIMKRDFPYIPVNTKAYLNNVNCFISNLGDQAVEEIYDREKRKLQVEAQLKEIDSISICDTVDAQIYNIMDSEVKAFIDGKYSAEQTAKIIQDKVMLYLNE
ncbi:extracellular solute-binding protein [Ruminiclostridium herbifermentans]|uniref:Extracellular solute-binding protein n=1 Tax=Ruminiclostridium herbifermentans TaxID=2488810 RepID=A0A4U7JGU4_9FIRM|nr:extracellular solute-binding protein [Ruminiclostridium herbifermentans]QNU67318.1 extracellular solute-binding protein [Ruminiclostridium herbifermentans]